MTAVDIRVNRGALCTSTSFLIWAKFRTCPQCDGDGVFVAEVPIGPNETSVTYAWETPNGSDNWKFIALPRYMEDVGIEGQLI